MVNLIKNKHEQWRNRCAAKQAVLLRNVLRIVNIIELTDFHVLFVCQSVLFSISLEAKVKTWGNFFFCNLLLHLPSEHIINLGEWNDGEQQHEAQPSHSVLFNCLRRLHGSCFIFEDNQRAGVCKGKPSPTIFLRDFPVWTCSVHLTTDEL